EALLRKEGPPESSRVWGEVAMMRARLAFITGDNDAACVSAFSADVSAARFGWKGIRGESLLLRARAARRREDSLAALPLLGEAARVIETEGDLPMLGRTLLIQGQVLGETGDIAHAGTPIDRAR